MKKFLRTITAIMLIVAVAFAAGCKKDPAEPNGGGSSLTEEGIYLGVIGFNDNLYTKEIGLLKNSTTNDYKTFINNLTPANGTALYYADYVALDKLKSSQEPPKLTNVVLVTFTDGLDNVSIGPSLPNPGNYNTDEEYRNALHNKIKNDIVHGKHINAYTIGLKGLDAQADLATFRANLKKLASDDNNVYEADNMNQALESFAEIAESLHSVSTTSKLMLKIPGGYNSGIQIRFTFDNVTSVENSNLYIEATYTKNASGLVLNNIVYHGFRNGATSLASVGVEGSYYQIMFENLTKTNGNLLSPNDINRIKLWKNNSSNWVPETEFTPNGSTQVIEEQSSALIMLVLDCTRSLGNDDFANMKTAAKRFVETLVTSTGGGGGNGGGSVSGDGLFSISSSQQVYFSQGNLQYQASTRTWRFAEHQWDYIGNSNSNISSSYSGWIDLFGWGTGNNPTKSSANSSDYSTFNDWGNDSISNGGGRRWFTLTRDEWVYVFNTRSTSSGIRYAKATVNGVNGVILLPDNWNSSNYSLSSTNNGGASFSSNRISQSDWTNRLEANGAVFLPAAGYRGGTGVSHVGSGGYYWAASYGGSRSAHYVGFGDEYLDPDNWNSRSNGQSVRLVCSAE